MDVGAAMILYGRNHREALLRGVRAVWPALSAILSACCMGCMAGIIDNICCVLSELHGAVRVNALSFLWRAPNPCGDVSYVVFLEWCFFSSFSYSPRGPGAEEPCL